MISFITLQSLEQFVFVNDIEFSVKSLQYGVAQGSELGSHLICSIKVYWATLTRQYNKSFYLYTDDM